MDDARPWLAHYPPGIDWNAKFPQLSLPQLFRVSAARYPDAPCVDFLGKRTTYREVSDLVSRAAKGLSGIGVGKGTRVALLLPNTPYYVITYYAVLELGGVIINMNPLYAEPEIRHLVEDAGAEFVVTLDLTALYDKVSPLVGRGSLRKVIVCRMAGILGVTKRLPFTVLQRGQLTRPTRDASHVDFASLIDNDGLFVPADIDPLADLALLQYTGGTTGTPKGAMLMHYNLVANAGQCLKWFGDVAPGQERFLAVLPFFHVFAMTSMLNVGLAAAAELTLLPRYTLDTFVAAIRRKRPTAIAGVPTLFTALCNYAKVDQVDFSSLKFCISGGAPLPVEIKTKFEKLTGCTVVEGYGLSETSPVVACNPVEGVSKAGSVGVPLPATLVRIAEPGGGMNILPQGERGEVLVKGPQVMAGYWHNPTETAHALQDGWFRTGDVGYLDEEGYLFIVDRLKDIIIAGGYKIYPRNVEEAIYRHPAVAECIVIGVPDPYRGQTVKAYIAQKAGQALTEEALLTFLKDKLSPIEMPRQFEFRDALPKTLIGKPSKAALLEEEAKRAGAAPAAPLQMKGSVP